MAAILLFFAYISVLQSGFEHKVKSHWLGPYYWKRSIEGTLARSLSLFLSLSLSLSLSLANGE